MRRDEQMSMVLQQEPMGTVKEGSRRTTQQQTYADTMPFAAVQSVPACPTVKTQSQVRSFRHKISYEAGMTELPMAWI